MSIVPVVPPPAPSAEADELGDQLKQTIERYRRDHPEMSDAEIRQAMDLAGKGTRPRHPAALVLLLAGFALLGVLVFRLLGRVLPAVGQAPILTLGIVIALLGLGLVVLFRHR